jgi:hypothetical protein
MAHSFVQAFPDEDAAFAAFARTAPGPVILPVDAYGPVPSGCTAPRAASTSSACAALRAIDRPATLRPTVSPALQALTDEVQERLERQTLCTVTLHR